MAKVLCAISGIEYRCDHMQMYLTSRESHHPIFDISTSKLLEVTPRWLDDELSATENYLLYLALFNSTGLMEFRVPATISVDTPAIVAQNMAPLAAIVERIYKTGSARIREQLHLPSFVITPDTKDLASSPDWIKIWEEAYKNYEDGYKTATLLERIERQETILERYIRDRTKDISSYANRLANWAYDAGGFEKHANFDIVNEKHQSEKLGDYWKRIIIACAKMESAWSLDETDLKELIEHCEEYIDHGSIYAHTLMSLLKAGAERKKSFVDLGDIDIGAHGTVFRILDANTSVEDANKLALIDSAPMEEPIEKNYPNKLAFIRAKMNWRMKQDYETSQKVQAKMEEIAAGPIVAQNNRREGDSK
jgi:hypothetical protein